MQVFPNFKAYFFITKTRFNGIRMYSVYVRLDSDDNRPEENPRMSAIFYHRNFYNHFENHL